MIYFSVIFYTTFIISCFLIMSETSQKGGWIKKTKFIFLFWIIMFPLIHYFNFHYFTLIAIFFINCSSFIIARDINFSKINNSKRMLLLFIYLMISCQLIFLIILELLDLIKFLKVLK